MTVYEPSHCSLDGQGIETWVVQVLAVASYRRDVVAR